MTYPLNRLGGDIPLGPETPFLPWMDSRCIAAYEPNDPRNVSAKVSEYGDLRCSSLANRVGYYGRAVEFSGDIGGDHSRAPAAVNRQFERCLAWHDDLLPTDEGPLRLQSGALATGIGKLAGPAMMVGTLAVESPPAYGDYLGMLRVDNVAGSAPTLGLSIHSTAGGVPNLVLAGSAFGTPTAFVELPTGSFDGRKITFAVGWTETERVVWVDGAAAATSTQSPVSAAVWPDDHEIFFGRGAAGQLWSPGTDPAVSLYNLYIIQGITVSETPSATSVRYDRDHIGYWLAAAAWQAGAEGNLDAGSPYAAAPPITTYAG
ncbi:hypothetical protein [Salipiger profundus]|uniref:hypothetical protein n=1 Tax=Salipiger profundus TaxID=1229727 RepID=UPI0008EA56D4|nr:hypothetical protein [Salipiger profundus]SFC10446.1 hypothetical protein SAMN05444415_102115 [Salipiger profundus]